MLRRSRAIRLIAAVRRELRTRPLYGMEWGDVDAVPPLGFVREHFVAPYVRPDHVGLEIGPGGGRWTQYMLGFRRLYVVDRYQEMLDEVKKNFRPPNLVPIRNNGTDFPGVEDRSVDFVFSFGVFVHLDVDLIEEYLHNMRPILKPGANAVIQYSDKTKVMAQAISSFSDNTPERMREMVTAAGYTICEEDLTSLWHSSIVRFTAP
jgi:SAM-dependent methyltransferase